MWQDLSFLHGHYMSLNYQLLLNHSQASLFFFFSRFLGPSFTDEKSYDLFLKPLLYIYFVLRIVIKTFCMIYVVLHDLPLLTSPVLGSTCGPLSLGQQGSPFSFSTLTFQTRCSYPLICFHIHGISPWCLVLLLWSYWLHDFHVHLWIPYSWPVLIM